VQTDFPDVKAEALLERIQQQQRDENDPVLKVLIFTEFVPTQAMLVDYPRRGAHWVGAAVAIGAKDPLQ
jgi:hypothetical protein